MRVLFANPPTYEASGTFNRPVRFPTFNYATPVIHPPLGLAYAAAYSRQRGHTVNIVDAQAESLDVVAFLDRAGQLAPDCVVMETSAPSFNNDARVAAEVKEMTGARVVFVGPHVSALPREALERSGVDAVVAGEYEVAVAEYLENGAQGVKGLYYRDEKGRLTSNSPREYLQDLDSMPFPARDLLPNERYCDPNMPQPFTFVLTGRGCPYRCTFCNWPQVFSGRRYRMRSPQKVVDELEGLEADYGMRSFLFNDDTFTAKRQHAIAVCEEIQRRRIRLPWGCYSRADNRDVEVLKKLRDAGCFLIKVGVESGDQSILNAVRKGYKLENVRRGVALMREMGFHVHCTFVFGLPGETKETIQRTIDFALSLKPTTVQFSTVVPYPGTEIYEYLDGEGWLLTRDWDDYMPMRPIFEYPHLSAEEIAHAVRTAYRRFFFRPSYILRTGIPKMLASPRQVFANFRALARLAF